MVYTLGITPIKNGAGTSQDRVVLYDSSADTRIPVVALPEGDITSSHWRYAAVAGGIVSSTAEIELGAATPGKRYYITDLVIFADPLGAAADLIFLDGTGGAAPILARVRLQTAGLPNGLVVPLRTPLKGSINTPLKAAMSAVVTGGVYVNGSGFLVAA